MSGASQSSGGGIGFLGLLTLLFIALKLGSVIDWSWWLVLLPLYGPITAFGAGLVIWALYKMFTPPRRKP